MKFDPEIRYGCIQCGKSCQRDWNIWTEPSSVPGALRVLQEENLVEEDGRWRLARGAAGCAFLQDRLCSIHSQFGYASKPFQCQQYPLLLTGTPDGLLVSASYTCSAVLQKSGPPLEDQRQAVEDLVKRGATIKKLTAGSDWPEIQRFEACFEPVLVEFGWDNALRRAIRTMLAGRLAGEGGTPADWWDTHQGVQLGRDNSLGWVLGALLKPCLAQHQSQLWQAVDQALLESGPLELPEFGYRGSAQEVLDWARTPLDDESDLERYRRSLWFRKQHLLCHSLFPGMLMLWTVGPLYRVLARWCGSHGALEKMELNLLGHSYVAQQIYPLICDYWISTYAFEGDGQK